MNDVSEKDQKRLLDEQVTLQEVYENEKVKCKQLEKDVSEFREELLKIKKEKHQLSNNLTIKEEEFKTKLDESNAQIVEHKKEVKSKCEMLDHVSDDLCSIKRENECTKKSLVDAKSELAELTVTCRDKLKHSFNCEKWDVSVETFSELWVHIRNAHLT